jgi:transposase
VARPTKLTPEIHVGIVTLVQYGVHPDVAAGAFGVGKATFFEWIARGEGTDPQRPSVPEYTAFAEDIRAAEFQAESALITTAVKKIRSTGDALAVAARRFPRWRERVDIHIELEAEVRKIADELGIDYQEALAEAERIMAGR